MKSFLVGLYQGTIRVFMIKEVPFLLVAFIGCLTWIFNELVNSVSDPPIIEYSLSFPNNNTLQCTFTNLTKNQLFKNIYLRIVNEPNRSLVQFLRGDVKPLPPAYQSKFNIKPDSTSKNTCNFEIEKMQPQSVYGVYLPFEGKFQKPILIFISAADDKPIIFKEAGWVTYLVKNKAEVLFILAILLLSVIIFYFHVILKTQKKKRPKMNPKLTYAFFGLFICIAHTGFAQHRKQQKVFIRNCEEKPITCSVVVYYFTDTKDCGMTTEFEYINNCKIFRSVAIENPTDDKCAGDIYYCRSIKGNIIHLYCTGCDNTKKIMEDFRVYGKN